MEKYSWEFIQTIAIWMNYGSFDKDNLKQLLKLNIPNKFKVCNSSIYRACSVNNNSVKFGVRSWTLDSNIAKDFTESSWFEEYNRKRILILKIDNPISSNVILNFNTLFRDKEFLNSIKFYEHMGKYFDEGLEFGNSQEEIIYKITKNDKINAIMEYMNGKWIKINQKVNIL